MRAPFKIWPPCYYRYRHIKMLFVSLLFLFYAFCFTVLFYYIILCFIKAPPRKSWVPRTYSCIKKWPVNSLIVWKSFMTSHLYRISILRISKGSRPHQLRFFWSLVHLRGTNSDWMNCTNSSAAKSDLHENKLFQSITWKGK